MSDNKFKQFWVFKGTSNHCSQLEYNPDTDRDEKCEPDRFYDYVCNEDTIEGGLHVIEYSALESANAEIAKLKNYRQHYTGATYELTQANFNGLIMQIEQLKEELHESYKGQNKLQYIIEGLHGDKTMLLSQNAKLTELVNELQETNRDLRKSNQEYARCVDSEQARNAKLKEELEQLKFDYECTEKVYRMNRQYVEDAKLKIAKLTGTLEEIGADMYVGYKKVCGCGDAAEKCPQGVNNANI